jgi:hypothetical protein
VETGSQLATFVCSDTHKENEVVGPRPVTDNQLQISGGSPQSAVTDTFLQDFVSQASLETTEKPSKQNGESSSSHGNKLKSQQHQQQLTASSLRSTPCVVALDVFSFTDDVGCPLGICACAYSNGVLNTWHFDDRPGSINPFLPLHSVRMFEEPVLKECSITLSKYAVYAVTLRGILATGMTRLAVDLDHAAGCRRDSFDSLLGGHIDGGASLTDGGRDAFLRHHRVVARIMNCGSCGKWDAVKPLSLCSGCFTTYFCDRNCQKAGWMKHKQYCKMIAHQNSLGGIIAPALTDSP